MATWYNLFHESPKSVCAVSEEMILDGCTDIDSHPWAKVDEALLASFTRDSARVYRTRASPWVPALSLT